jgi:hypothetical protein
MRNVAQHSSLADIVLIRRLISLHALIPLPADAVVTPITFVVPRQSGDDIARGFLRSVTIAYAPLESADEAGIRTWRRVVRGS